MKLSVIVPTYNRPSDLTSLLDSVLLQTRLPDEVIIVDQSENTLTKDLVETFDRSYKDKGIRFIWHYQKDKGSAKARNAGFRASTGDIVCFTDDDIVLEKSYFKEIADCFEQYPDIGGISGNVEVPQPPSGLKWSLRKFLLRLFMIDYLNGTMTASSFGYPIYQREIEELLYVELICGYSMNFRRPYLERDLFDEFFTGYSFREDVELSFRISRQTKLAMIPHARFQHNVSTTNRTDLNILKKMQFRNYYYIFNKHKNYSPLSPILFGYSICGLLLIDLMEWLSGFKPIKWKIFTMDVCAVGDLMMGKL